MRHTHVLAVWLALTGTAVAQQGSMFLPVRAAREMAGGGNNFIVEAGFRILTQGGNAVDADVASGLAAEVTEQDHFGLGGEMPLLITDG